MSARILLVLVEMNKISPRSDTLGDRREIMNRSSEPMLKELGVARRRSVAWKPKSPNTLSLSRGATIFSRGGSTIASGTLGDVGAQTAFLRVVQSWSRVDGLVPEVAGWSPDCRLYPIAHTSLAHKSMTRPAQRWTLP